MTELTDYCPRCKRITPSKVWCEEDWVIWTCEVCGYILDEDWIDNCDLPTARQAELESW